MSVKLSPRLMSALPYVRGNRLLADVGTDHAYLPIYLCESGVLTPVTVADGSCLAAIASDINRGPTERAELHIAMAGLSSLIRAIQTDGLAGLDRYDPEDIIIFGMGGELIASILADAPWVARPGRRLILQPMTHPEKLRAHLLDAGFAILGETLSREGERIYQTLCAEYTGALTDALSPAELAVGQSRHRMGNPEQEVLYAELIRKTLRTERAARDARRAAGQNTAPADALIAELDALLAAIS